MKEIKDKLSPEEQALATAANTPNTGQGIEARVVTDLWVSHRLREMTDQMIQSNEKLAGANDKHTEALVRATNWLAVLTGLLVLVTLAQFLPLLPWP